MLLIMSQKGFLKPLVNTWTDFLKPSLIVFKKSGKNVYPRSFWTLVHVATRGFCIPFHDRTCSFWQNKQIQKRFSQYFFKNSFSRSAQKKTAWNPEANIAKVLIEYQRFKNKIYVIWQDFPFTSSLPIKMFKNYKRLYSNFKLTRTCGSWSSNK